ncbi:hypothetical protein F4778DRAFT_786651 [Xylariomycetidae sp. FL2044]|nr:hypothetical protein F4778DRAFT_786651 [Xylariomycetidae sp. FL2044]
MSRYPVRGAPVARIEFQAPRDPASLVFNCWSDGGAWSGVMAPGGVAEMQIQWIEGESSRLDYKLFARKANIFSKRNTTFWYISRDDPAYVPSLHALFAMLKEGQIEVPIKQVWQMDQIKEAHRTWGKGGGMGSFLIHMAPERR